MKYDDAAWHYEGNFPKDLPWRAAATHTGMFVAWALLRDLASERHLRDFPQGVLSLRARRLTPGLFFLSTFDGKFSNDDLNAEGNAFAAHYYDLQNGQFIKDYEAALAVGVPEAYYVKDSWENFDLISPLVDDRLAAWRASRSS
jgi:hypothetical protein